MVCQDGFITSHSLVNVNIYDDADVKKFTGTYRPQGTLLNSETPISVGTLDFYDYFFEHKKQNFDAMENVKKVLPQIQKEFSETVSGKKYGFVEKYFTDDAEHIVVAMSSACGILKGAIDELRAKGKKVGLLKIVLFRPFPEFEVAEALHNAKSIIVMDRVSGNGAYSPLYNEISSALYHYQNKPKLVSYVFGLGGRNFGHKDALNILAEFDKIDTEFLDHRNKLRYYGVRE
jgi:pyruvate ferredoxin oxidoreductase alpha subunit